MTATATVTATVKEMIIYQQSTNGDGNRDRKGTGTSIALLQAGNKKLKREHLLVVTATSASCNGSIEIYMQQLAVEAVLALALALNYCKLVTGKLLEGNNKLAANARTSASGQWSWCQHWLITVSSKQTDQQQHRSNVNPLFCFSNQNYCCIVQGIVLPQFCEMPISLLSLFEVKSVCTKQGF